MEHEKSQETVTNNESNNEEKRKGSDKRRLIIKISVIIAIIIILLLLLFKCSTDYYKPNELEIPDDNIVEGIIEIPDDQRSMEIQSEVDEIVKQGMFQVFMNTTITINEEGFANLLIQNSENNHYPVYVDISCGDKTIYKSGIIQTGYKLEQDKIVEDLEPGVYECKATFHILDSSDTTKEINTVGLSVIIEKKG